MVRPTGQTCMPALCWRECGLRGRTAGKRGTTKVFPLLSITLFPSGHAARARVSDAFRLPPGCCCDRQGIGCHPRGRARSARPYDGLNGASLWGGTCPSCCFGQMGGGNLGVTHLARAARPYLRQQMPPIFGQMLTCLLLPQRKRGDSQEGRNFVSPLLCARRPRRPHFRP